MSESTMPYGAMPPEPDKAEQEEEVIVPEVQEVKEEVKEPDWKKSFEELHKKFGAHTAEVKSAREESRALKQQMADLQQQALAREKEARNAPPPTDYEKMLSDIAEKLDNGELSEREALVQSNKITYERAKAEAAMEKENLLNQTRAEVQGILQQKDDEQLVNKFMDSNPDYTSLYEQGVFQQIRAEDPLLSDDLSAYWKHKAMTAAQEKAAAFEQGKMEALRVKSGSEKAGKVISDPGTSMQQQKSNKPATEADIKAAMLSRFA